MEFSQFFRQATQGEPYEYQREFAEAARLPDLLEAPTGSGKTATAILGWMWRRFHGGPDRAREAGRRLVFCLPMRTLVEQTERVARTWIDRLGYTDSVGVHVLLGGSVDEAWQDRPDQEVILIGTQDQLLSRALMRGYAMSRFRWPIHFALLNNDCTWVMDEVQLMGVGASTGAQLQAFRERYAIAGSTKTVWMTATLSEGRLNTVDVRREFSRQPFLAREEALLKRLRAKKTLTKARFSVARKSSLADLAREVTEAHEPGTLTLVVVNRVARAQELRRLLAKTVERVALIHSRFRPQDRRRIQEEALSGSFQGVVVATQAVEAGVDVSAKTLFTELAPWSSLVQRFGRLNRAGEHAQSRAVWIDIDTSDEDGRLPYEEPPLVAARDRLGGLGDVGPQSLAAVPRDPEEPVLPVLRRKDLLELFNTEPDLAGHDIDVSQYVRATEDRDVQVAWREIGKGPPSEDAPDLHRDELCSVPIHDLAKLTKDVWRFDSLLKKWMKIDRLFPGLAVVIDVAAGGYDPELGFTRERDDRPAALQVHAEPPDFDEADGLSWTSADFVGMQLHAEDTAEEMTSLLAHLGEITGPFAPPEGLVDAARWHDVGKVHPAFQEMLLAGLPTDDPRRTGGPWAKSDGHSRARNRRRYFRHELASALAWLASGKSDLGGFLIAAHHGKVRLSLRARPGEEPPADADPMKRFAHGVVDGDRLPAVHLGGGVTVNEQVLSLACMELGGAGQGPTWTERMNGVLDNIGPFRLAYLEMLLRVADWRASARRSPRLTAAEVRRG